MFGEGISQEGGLLDVGVAMSLVTKTGAWFTFGETRLGQGREAAKEFLKSNPDYRRPRSRSRSAPRWPRSRSRSRGSKRPNSRPCRRRTGPQRLEARKARLERHAARGSRGRPECRRSIPRAQHRVRSTRSGATWPRPKYPAELVEGALDRLLELGVLDDRAFASAWVESSDRARPRGETALRRELISRGSTRRSWLAECWPNAIRRRAEMLEPRAMSFSGS